MPLDHELEEFYSLLENHDWTFAYSDDHRAYTKGNDSLKVIQATMQENDRLMRLWEDYADSIWNHTEKPNIDDYR